MYRIETLGFACLVQQGVKEIELLFGTSLMELKKRSEKFLAVYGATLTFYHASYSAERRGFPNVNITLYDTVVRQGVTLHLPSNLFTDNDFK